MAEVSLQTPDLMQHNIVYKKNNLQDFLYFTQDPLPFCFSVTANIMLDKKMCDLNPSLCGKRSSFLESSVLGVEEGNKYQTKSFEWGVKPPNVAMEGGNYDTVIAAVKKRGYLVTNDSCNYNHITDNLSWLTSPAFQLKVNKLKEHHTIYHKYKGYSRYYADHAHNQFKYILEEIKIKQSDAVQLIEERDFQQVLNKMVFNPNCSLPQKYEIPKNFKLKNWDVSNKVKDINKRHSLYKEKIISLLKENHLVGISFCLKDKIASLEKDVCNYRHSLVISGYAELIDKSDPSKTKKTAYYVVNSWGEVWQQKTGGLVWADNLHEYMYGSLSWID